jgi:hypothetical protein
MPVPAESVNEYRNIVHLAETEQRVFMKMKNKVVDQRSVKYKHQPGKQIEFRRSIFSGGGKAHWRRRNKLKPVFIAWLTRILIC